MLIGLVRPRESRSLQVQGDSLEEVRQRVDELIPAGFELASMPVRMTNETITLTSTATLTKRDGREEIRGEDMATLRTKVPEGWQLLSVRRD